MSALRLLQTKEFVHSTFPRRCGSVPSLGCLVDLKVPPRYRHLHRCLFEGPTTQLVSEPSDDSTVICRAEQLEASEVTPVWCSTVISADEYPQRRVHPPFTNRLEMAEGCQWRKLPSALRKIVRRRCRRRYLRHNFMKGGKSAIVDSPEWTVFLDDAYRSAIVDSPEWKVSHDVADKSATVDSAERKVSLDVAYRSAIVEYSTKWKVSHDVADESAIVDSAERKVSHDVADKSAIVDSAECKVSHDVADKSAIVDSAECKVSHDVADKSAIVDSAEWKVSHDAADTSAIVDNTGWKVSHDAADKSAIVDSAEWKVSHDVADKSIVDTAEWKVSHVADKSVIVDSAEWKVSHVADKSVIVDSAEWKVSHDAIDVADKSEIVDIAEWKVSHVADKSAIVDSTEWKVSRDDVRDIRVSEIGLGTVTEGISQGIPGDSVQSSAGDSSWKRAGNSSWNSAGNSCKSSGYSSLNSAENSSCKSSGYSSLNSAVDVSLNTESLPQNTGFKVSTDDFPQISEEDFLCSPPQDRTVSRGCPCCLAVLAHNVVYPREGFVDPFHPRSCNYMRLYLYLNSNRSTEQKFVPYSRCIDIVEENSPDLLAQFPYMLPLLGDTATLPTSRHGEAGSGEERATGQQSDVPVTLGPSEQLHPFLTERALREEGSGAGQHQDQGSSKWACLSVAPQPIRAGKFGAIGSKPKTAVDCVDVVTDPLEILTPPPAAEFGAVGCTPHWQIDPGYVCTEPIHTPSASPTPSWSVWSPLEDPSRCIPELLGIIGRWADRDTDTSPIAKSKTDATHKTELRTSEGERRADPHHFEELPPNRAAGPIMRNGFTCCPAPVDQEQGARAHPETARPIVGKKRTRSSCCACTVL